MYNRARDVTLKWDKRGTGVCEHGVSTREMVLKDLSRNAGSKAQCVQRDRVWLEGTSTESQYQVNIHSHRMQTHTNIPESQYQEVEMGTQGTDPSTYILLGHESFRAGHTKARVHKQVNQHIT